MLIAIGNSREPALAAVAAERLDDKEPLVRGAAVWASAQLLADEEFAVLRQARAETERDPSVAEEWRVAPGASVR